MLITPPGGEQVPTNAILFFERGGMWEGFSARMMVGDEETTLMSEQIPDGESMGLGRFVPGPLAPGFDIEFRVENGSRIIERAFTVVAIEDVSPPVLSESHLVSALPLVSEGQMTGQTVTVHIPRSSDDFGLGYTRMDITNSRDVSRTDAAPQVFFGDVGPIQAEAMVDANWSEACVYLTVVDWSGNATFSAPVCAPLRPPTQDEIDASFAPVSPGEDEVDGILPVLFGCTSPGGEGGGSLLLLGLLLWRRKQWP